jgi:hypothetical protein
MSRELYESPTSAWDVEIRVRRLEDRVARLEAALARRTEPVADPTADRPDGAETISLPSQ